MRLRKLRRLVCRIRGHRWVSEYNPDLDASWHRCTVCDMGHWNDRLGCGPGCPPPEVHPASKRCRAEHPVTRSRCQRIGDNHPGVHVFEIDATFFELLDDGLITIGRPPGKKR